MINNKIISFFLFAFFLGACSQNNEAGNAKADPATATKTSPTKGGENLPSITMEIMTKIFEESDYADFVFYNTNFSMSMDQKVSIQGTLRHVSEKVPLLNPKCKAIGRVFYQIEGENYMEADIFFEQDCKYYIFYENGKKSYANQMTQDGVNHYANIFSQLGSPQGQ